MIAKHKLIKNVYYIGTCRNTSIAQWDGDKFIFINYNFKEPYIETIHYFGDVINKNTDGFIPIRAIITEYIEFKEARIEQYYKNVFRNIYKDTTTKILPEEKWVPVVGYEGIYMISNLGRVSSVKRDIILKQNFSRGYLIIGLTNKNGIRKTERIHRLVLFAFKGEFYKPNKEGNHINNVKSDNRASNLEWVYHSDNSRKMYLNNHFNKKLKVEDVIKIKSLLKDGVRGVVIAKMFNTGTSVISEIKNKRIWIDV
jgi:hypothetical protein